MASQVSVDAFKTIFPRYSELLEEDNLSRNEPIESFLREELPRKVQLVRGMEYSFNCFLTHFTSIIVKRPPHSNLVHSIMLKVGDKIEKLFNSLASILFKTKNSDFKDSRPEMDIQVLKRQFRNKLQRLNELLKDKFLGGNSLQKQVEEEITLRLYVLLQIYHFLKGDPVNIAGKFKLREDEVLYAINKNETPHEINSLIILQSTFLSQLEENVRKRCRPFTNKRQLLESKIREVLRQSESKVGFNLQLMLESIISKERIRVSRQLSANLTRQMKELPEGEGQTQAKEIISQVQLLKRQFSQLKNNMYFLDLMRGNFSQKYKMQINKLQNIFYLTNLEKYLQDVSTFLEKVLQLQEKIIKNRRDYMRTFGNNFQDKITNIIYFYKNKYPDSANLSDIISDQFSLLQSALYGVVSNKNVPTKQSSIGVSRSNYQDQRKKKIQERAEQERSKRQLQKQNYEQKKKKQEEKMLVAKFQRQQKEKKKKQEAERLQYERKLQFERRKEEKSKRDEELRRQYQQEQRKKQDEKRRKEQQDKIKREELNKNKSQEDDKKKRQRQDQIRKKQQERKSILEREQRQKKQKQSQLKERQKKDEEERKRRQNQKKLQQQRLRKQKQQRQIQQTKRQQQRLRTERQKKMTQEKRKQQEKLRQVKQNQEKQRKMEQQKRQKQEQAKVERERKQREQKQKKQRQERQRQQKQRRQNQGQQRKQREQREKKERLQKQKRQRQEKQRKEKEQSMKRQRQREQLEKRDRQQRESRDKEERQRKQRQRRQRQQNQRKQRERQATEKRQRQDKQRLQRQKKEKERLQKQRQDKERQEKDKQQRQKLQRQKMQKQKQERQRQDKQKRQRQLKQQQQSKKQLTLKKQAQEKAKRQKQQRQRQENERKAQQLKKKQLQQKAKKQQEQKGSKVPKKEVPKKGSAIDYGDFGDIMDDDLQQMQKAGKLSPSGINSNINPDEDDYEVDDFEQQSPDKQGQIETKQLISIQDIKCLNEYMKGTSYSRKNKVNAELLNKNSTYLLLFQELVQNKKVFFFEGVIGKAVLDLGEELTNTETNQEDLRMSVQTIKEEMLRVYDQIFQGEEINLNTRFIFPISFANQYKIKAIEMIPEICYFRVIFAQALPEDEEVQSKFQGIIQALLHVFELDGEPQLEDVVLNEQTNAVLATFDKQLPCLLIIFAMHYERLAGKEILVNQYTIERFFYTAHVIEPLYDVMKDGEEIDDFFGKLTQKYSKNDKIKICNILVNSSDEQYSQKLTHQAIGIKQQFIKGKQSTMLASFSVEIQDESGQIADKIVIYLSVEKATPKATMNYYIITKDPEEQDNASLIFDMIAEGDENFEVAVYTDFSRHNCLSSYSDWSLPLWAHVITKRKLSVIKALRSMCLSMTPFYLAFKQMD